MNYTINFSHLRILCESIARSMIGGRKPITIKVTGGDGSVTSDEAIALGLLTTELVINALKHAFPGGTGQITVTYESKPASWKLSIGMTASDSRRPTRRLTRASAQASSPRSRPSSMPP